MPIHGINFIYDSTVSIVVSKLRVMGLLTAVYVVCVCPVWLVDQGVSLTIELNGIEFLFLDARYTWIFVAALS